MAKITWAKLRDGSWGLRSSTPLSEGAVVTVTKRSGETSQATVGGEVWSAPDKGVYLYRLASDGQQRQPRKPRRARALCDECGEYPAIKKALDASGLEGNVCRRCARLRPCDRSFM